MPWCRLISSMLLFVLIHDRNHQVMDKKAASVLQKKPTLIMKERKMTIFRVVLVLFLLLAYPAANASAEHRLGGGVNYWVMLDDIDDGFDDKGLSYLVSYQYWAGLLGVELDVELLPDRLDETAVAPQAYLLVGKGIYGGAGIGIINSGGDFADKPFFALKAGVNLELLPSTFVDISANYRFSDKEDLNDDNKNIDTDTVFLGAAFRFAL